MTDFGLHDTDAADVWRESVAAAWGEVFGPIDDLSRWRDELWDRHRGRAGYRLATAHDAGRLVGFSWGYTGERGQWFSDRVLATLGEVAEPWVGGHFEFVELAVIPAARHQGVGGRLHDLIMDGLPNRRALLSTTMRPDDPAPRLYASRGWRHLGSHAPDAQIMGRMLTADLR